MKTGIDRKKKQEIAQTKAEFKPLEVFISYSHRDEALREELIKHLSALRRENVIGLWHDRMIGAGAEWRIESLDYLVISGDLTNRGAYEEFERVHDFLSHLVKEMKLTAERTIIVPGNHDLSWDEEVYEWMHERKVDLSALKPDYYLRQGKGYLVRDDALYPTRFKNFARFHHQFKQLEYSLKPEAQSLSVLFEETGIQFLALNSAWMIDEYHPDRSGVNEKALAKGLIEADRRIEEAKKAKLMKEDAPVLRIAVWHHPATGAEKIVDDDFIERLRRADFKLCLHGHVHEDRADLVGYLHPLRKLHMAGAGSFGAVAAHRPPSTPRLYNLIEIPRDHSLIRIHTRCMRKESGAWDGWAVWPGENASVKKAFYEIKPK